MAVVSMAVLLGGCQTAPATSDQPVNPALRVITSPAGAAPADVQRAALARFVGTWNFEGWSSGDGTLRNRFDGRAAGTIENEHFVLLDLEATAGRLAGKAGRKSGSLFFASEPGIGLTLSAWGDASPSVSRFVGTALGGASVFRFREVRSASGSRIALAIKFETDDRWSAELRDLNATGEPVIAYYTFTRSSP